MTYTITPTVIEIYEADNMLAAKVIMFNEGAANVDIKTVVTRKSFDALVPSIQQALDSMKLVGDV